ncbi:hypothetical protein RclHR1_00330032 [Rhizophagus clarus]|nr:hypothetical protein RclHR1_00330032 [Rhizophagus clarus]
MLGSMSNSHKVIIQKNPLDLIDDKTKSIYLESMGNPKFNISDFEANYKAARYMRVPVVVHDAVGADKRLSYKTN